jgi:hypothetical protein
LSWRSTKADPNETLRALTTQVQQLHETIARQHDDMAEQQAQLNALRDEVMTLRRAEALAATLSGGRTPQPPSARTSRRTLLKLGGAAAVATAVAISATELAHPGVAQADGVPWQTGVVNSDNQTFVEPSNSSFPDPTLLTVRIGTASPYQVLSNANQAAIAAYDTTGGAHGLYATSLNGFAVLGAAPHDVGVYGSSEDGFGITGVATTTGIGGVFQGGRAQLRLTPGGFAGSPSSGNHIKGELYLDSVATLWICINAGVPGTWVQVATFPSGTLGGAPTFLSAPIRIFDTRLGQPAPLPASKHQLASGSTTTIQVTGTVVGGLSVPSGAKAVIGNLTVTNTAGPGVLILWPHGASQPLTSNINYPGGLGSGGGAPAVANFANVGLSSGGAMDLFVVGAGTNALFDVAGFIF